MKEKKLEGKFRGSRPTGEPSRVAETFPGYRRAGSLGENAPAGQECPAYRIFENAGFPRVKHGAGWESPE